jgi:hypothetical protein
MTPAASVGPSCDSYVAKGFGRLHSAEGAEVFLNILGLAEAVASCRPDVKHAGLLQALQAMGRRMGLPFAGSSSCCIAAPAAPNSRRGTACAPTISAGSAP